jgi:Fe-S-cluster containining protein
VIDCQGCLRNCCGEIPDLTPVLLEREEKDILPEHLLRVEIGGYVLSLIRRKPDGTCVFWKDRKCSIYAKRPLECRLYPYLLDFSMGTARIELDTRFCKRLETIAPKEYFSDMLTGINPTPEWIKAFETIEGC